ncbi:unnamed protein product [Camellia sinensis]
MNPPTKMQSILNLHGSSGLPLCLSGITHPLSLSKEMEDHDRRREAMRKQKGEAREVTHANQEMGIVRSHERDLEESREGEVDGDLAGLLHDLGFSCTAKAA